MLIFYVIGFPLVGSILLIKNRKKLHEPEVIQYILLLYQGLKQDRFYWEFANTTRKVALLCLHVFISDELKALKVLFGSLVLFSFSIFQGRLRPYKIDVVTDLEHREMLASMLTLYGGLIFIQDDGELRFMHIVIFVLIAILNARFWILWIF
jgi:hypothetical protein